MAIQDRVLQTSGRTNAAPTTTTPTTTITTTTTTTIPVDIFVMIEHMDVRTYHMLTTDVLVAEMWIHIHQQLAVQLMLSIRQSISENTVSSVHHKSLVLSINRCVKYSLFLKKFTLYGVFYSVFYTYVTYDMYSIILYYIFNHNICFGKQPTNIFDLYLQNIIQR